MTTPTPKIYILHENESWTAPLESELAKLGSPYTSWFVNEGIVDLSEPPPAGIFYNRMSASSHTRDHRYAPEHTAAILDWLEAHGRIVLNTSSALRLEVNKVAQYRALNHLGIQTPRTVIAVGRDQIVHAARRFRGKFITKHNRGGKGMGVHLFQDQNSLKKYIHSKDYVPPIDGITLLQQYIHSPQQKITRCEFVGQAFLYAVEVDTSQGFELCPADQCSVGDDNRPVSQPGSPRFEINDTFDSPLLAQYQRFLVANDIHIAGIEFIVDEKGEAYTYDINTNTNYNASAEHKAGLSGMAAIAQYLTDQLRASQTSNPIETIRLAS